MPFSGLFGVASDSRSKTLPSQLGREVTGVSFRLDPAGSHLHVSVEETHHRT